MPSATVSPDRLVRWDADDYRAFEAAIIADYDAQSAVERELVLRLAGLLWRLRRSTIMETGLFEIQAAHLRAFRRARQLHRALETSSMRCSGRLTRSMRTTIESCTASQTTPILGRAQDPNRSIRPPTLARCFLRLANLPNHALDRLSRYDAILWRQAGQILFAFDALQRRKPQERRSRFRSGRHELAADGHDDD